MLAAVERKSLDNLAATLSDGTLAFQLQRLAELPLAALVVEARYGALFKLEHVNGNWLADQLARLQGPLPRSSPRLRRLPPLRRRLDLPLPHHRPRRRHRPKPERRLRQPHLQRHQQSNPITQSGFSTPTSSRGDRRGAACRDVARARARASTRRRTSASAATSRGIRPWDARRCTSSHSRSPRAPLGSRRHRSSSRPRNSHRSRRSRPEWKECPRSQEVPRAAASAGYAPFAKWPWLTKYVVDLDPETVRNGRPWSSMTVTPLLPR
jgi:hypothetical protein